MSDSKEFQGKNLDEAIEAACRHFDLKRDKLEIEIVSGGSSGIFGLVGVKKAVVRAKPRGSFKPLVEPEPERRAEKPARPERQERQERPAPAEPAREPVTAAAPPEQSSQPAEPAADEAAPVSAPADAASPAAESAPEGQDGQEGSRRSRSRRGRGRGERSGERQGERQGDRQDERGDKPAEKSAKSERGERSDRSERSERGDRGEREANRSRRRERPRRDADPQQPRREAPLSPEDEEGGAPQGIAHLDPEQLKAVATEVTHKLLLPLVENAQISVELLTDRVCVRIEDPDNTGLLIGREGQTLASIQYLVNRLVSKRMESSVRVQIDAGDYRENQDERLRQIARHLADKAMATGRTQSTRPMSSYHRRVVHLTLQDDEHVFTRSKGEGAMKRVLIMTKRRGKDGELLEDAGADAEPRDIDDSAAE